MKFDYCTRYDSTVSLIKQLREEGVKIGVASSSKVTLRLFYLLYRRPNTPQNCRPILEKANLTSLFDSIVDGVDLEKEGIKGKPAPDMFLW